MPPLMKMARVNWNHADMKVTFGITSRTHIVDEDKNSGHVKSEIHNPSMDYLSAWQTTHHFDPFGPLPLVKLAKRFRP
jgi:hypothetical protein